MLETATTSATQSDTLFPYPVGREGPNLLRAAQKLDEEALTSIFDQFAPAIYKYTLRLCHDVIVADNIVGDVFANLLEQFAAGKGAHTNLRSYLYQTAYHEVVNRSRENTQSAPFELYDLWKKENARSFEVRAEEQAKIDAILSIMNKELTEDQRHVIILRFLEDFSLKETAAIIGKGVNNIKVIQNRAIGKIRKQMHEKFGYAFEDTADEETKGMGTRKKTNRSVWNSYQKKGQRSLLITDEG